MAGEQGGFFQEVVKIGVMTVLAILIIGLAAMSAGLVFEEDILGLGFGDDPEGGNGTAETEGGTQAEEDEGTEDGGARPEIEDRIEVFDDELIREDAGTGYESVRVEGTIRNVGNTKVSSMEVRIRFMDGEGFTGNVERETVTQLDPNQTWDFDVAHSGIGKSVREVEGYDINLVE